MNVIIMVDNTAHMLFCCKFYLPKFNNNKIISIWVLNLTKPHFIYYFNNLNQRNRIFYIVPTSVELAFSTIGERLSFKVKNPKLS